MPINSFETFLRLDSDRGSNRPLLIGTSIENCLEELKRVLVNWEAGSVIYIEGSGGTGKSELLRRLELAFRNLNSEYQDQTNSGLPVEQERPWLFGGIVDLYDPVTYHGRGIEQLLVQGWSKRYKQIVSKSSPGKFHTSFRQLRGNPQQIFKVYNEKVLALRKLRFDAPSLMGAKQVVRQRNEELDDLFRSGLAVLRRRFIPVICFDTAELLYQGGDAEQPDTDLNETWAWLYSYLASENRKHCITIIAGRPFGEKKSFYTPESKDKAKSFLDIISQVVDDCPFSLPAESQPDAAEADATNKTKFRYLPLEAFTETEIVAFLEEFYRKSLKAEDDSKAEIGLPSEEAVSGEAVWKSFFGELTNFELITPRTIAQLTSPEEPTGELPKTPRGKPLLVEWLCRLVQLPDVLELPGLSDAGINPAEFKARLAEVILDPSKRVGEEIRGMEEEAFDLLVYAFVARRGLDTSTIVWLSQGDTGRIAKQPIDPQKFDLNKLLAILEQDPFVKMQVLNSSTEDVATDKTIFLHDEIYENLRGYIETRFNGRLENLRRRLDEGFTDPAYKRCIYHLKNSMNQLIQPQPDLNRVTGELGQAGYWFEDSYKVQKYIELEKVIHSRLVERLYYRLKYNYDYGYEEYNRRANIALAEYDVTLYTRLRKELRRFEQEEERQPAVAVDKVEWVVYQLEKEIRDIKRTFLREFDTIAERNTGDVDLDRQSLARLKNAANPAGKLAELRKQANIRLNLNKKPLDEKEQNCRWRLQLALADARISIYDNEPILEATPADLKRFHKVVTDLEKLGAGLEGSKAGELGERSTINAYWHWQKHTLLGRAYDALGLIQQKNQSLDNAIEYYKRAIESLKQAVDRVDIYLNDSRINLSFTYSLRGRKSIALELCKVALEVYLRQGHRAYIAMAENVLAQILMTSRNTLEEAYRYSFSSLQRYEAIFLSEERASLYAYQLARFTFGKITRRLGRSYIPELVATTKRQKSGKIEVSTRNARHLLIASEWYLKGAARYFDNDKSSENYKVDAINEWGCTLRTMARFYEPNSAQHKRQLAKARQKLEQARKMAAANKYLWFQKIDAMLELLQIDTNETPGEVAMIKRQFKQLAQEMKQLRSRANSPDEMNVAGIKLAYSMLEGRICMRRADWIWERYNLATNENTKAKLYQLYLSLLIQSLGWFVRYERNIITDHDYLRDMGYIRRIEERLGQHVVRHDHRTQAIEVARKIYETKVKKAKKTQPDGFRPDTENGLRLFAYIINIRTFLPELKLF